MSSISDSGELLPRLKAPSVSLELLPSELEPEPRVLPEEVVVLGTLLVDPEEVPVPDELPDEPADAVLVRLTCPGRLDRLLEERVVLYGDVDE